MAGRYGLEIRGVTAVDAAGLAALMKSVGRPVAFHVLAERLERLSQEPGAVLLALEWGPPSGIIALSWRHTLEADAPVAWITTLMVAPDARRRGVARLLLKAGARAARRVGCASLRLVAPLEAFELEACCRATGFVEAGSAFERPLRKQV